MANLPKESHRPSQVQIDTLIQQTERAKVTRSSPLEREVDKSSRVRQPFPIWQITMPLGIVLIFAIGSLTAYFMSEGRFLFDLYISREQIRIRTDVDKRQSDLSRENGARSNHENIRTTRWKDK